jgi:hypothetical protein
MIHYKIAGKNNNIKQLTHSLAKFKHLGLIKTNKKLHSQRSYEYITLEMLATILYHSLLTINLGLIIRRIIIFPVV